MQAALLVVGAAAPAQLARVLAAAERLDGPVTLAPVAAELVPCLRAQPALATQLCAASAQRRVTSLLLPAHGGDAQLLDADELADELRLADELLQSLGATAERRGTLAGGDTRTLEGAGIDFVIAPELDGPARVGERLIALPLDGPDACIVRVDGDDEAALEAGVARVAAALRDGAQLVAVETIAARLTPPWLPPAALTSPLPAPAARLVAEVCRWLVGAFDRARAPRLPLALLADEGWRLERLPPRARLPLLRRRAAAATRRALVAAFELCDVLSVEARVPGRAPCVRAPLGDGVLARLAAWGELHGAGEPLSRAAAVYDELQRLRFHGSLRWRALAAALRDGFALLSARTAIDWQRADEPPAARDVPAVREEPQAPSSLLN